MKNNIKEFKKHVKKYDIKDEKIQFKFKHSKRVMKLSKHLAKKIKLNKEDIELAKTIGLLHDYARFEQWTKYQTFSDLNSIDHGDYGVKLLFEDKEIEKFEVNKKDYDIISNVIKYHNKYKIIDTLDDKNKLQCQIIRDSDKLDIIYICSKSKKMIDIKDKVSKKVETDFYNNKMIQRIDMKSKSDDILLELSWVFDLNFKESFNYLKKKNYLWKIYKNISNKEKYLDYFKYADNYINMRLK